MSNNIGETEFVFTFAPFLNISQGTGAIFIGGSMYVTTKPGLLYNIRNYKTTKNTILVKNLLSENNFTSAGEGGLLGIATANNILYLSATYSHGSTDPFALYLSVSEYNLFTLAGIRRITYMPFKTLIHHAGHIAFGPDGKLYLSTGDGGLPNDETNEAQNPTTLRGKILRITPQPRNIEIVAMGLRNPWQFSFDHFGRIFIGDVGAARVEEIDVIVKKNKIYNFGWSYFEGTFRNKPGKPFSDFTPPIFEYPRSDQTGRAIIGGYFINTDGLGLYIFGDLLGFVRAIRFDGTKWIQIANNKLDDNIYAFAYDGENIYILGGNRIYRLIINKL